MNLSGEHQRLIDAIAAMPDVVSVRPEWDEDVLMLCVACGDGRMETVEAIIEEKWRWVDEHPRQYVDVDIRALPDNSPTPFYSGRGVAAYTHTATSNPG